MAAAAEADHPTADSADADIRRIARLHQAQAFDNVELDRLLEERPLTSERARWIGRRLMLAGKGIQAYQDGQRVLSLLERRTVPFTPQAIPKGRGKGVAD